MTSSKLNSMYWSEVETVKIWEAAAMLYGWDPRAIRDGEVVVNTDGDSPDLTDEERLLTSAVLSGTLEACPPNPNSPNRDTHLSTRSFVSWMKSHGYTPLADRLGGHRQAQQEPQRRLSRLQELGGSINKSRMGKWRIDGLGALIAAEKADGYDRVSAKTVRGDLIEAAEHETGARAEGRLPTFPRSSGGG